MPAIVPFGLVYLVERGVVPVSVAFTAAARALGVDTDPFAGAACGPPIADPRAEHAGIPALRMALDNDEYPKIATERWRSWCYRLCGSPLAESRP